LRITLSLVGVDFLLPAAWTTGAVFLVDADVLFVATAFTIGFNGRVASFVTFPSRTRR